MILQGCKTMDIERIKTTLNDNFADITEPSDEIFRATKKHQEGVYQVHYFDLSQELFNKDFDFDRYQRQLLVKDFYSVEGALQWNFYLHFLVDDKNANNPNFSSVKSKIEADRRLARKSVSTYVEFEKSFRSTKDSREHTPIDIVDRWKDSLSNELIDVLDEKIAMTSVVSSFIDGEQGKKAAPRIARTDVEDFPLIGKLTLKQYRSFPSQRTFDFGRVNLISGPNAVGKTSLLEAFELMVCGKTMRNSKIEEDFKFNITPFGTIDSKEISRESDVEYRSRDYFWYGRNYSRGNELINSFSRFNFFDADAAVRFSERIDSGGGLGKTLTQIVFGPDANRLFERIGKIKNRFKESLTYFQRLINTDIETKENIDQELKSKTKADAEKISQELIQKRLETIGVQLSKFEIHDLELFIRKIGDAMLSVASWKVAMERFGVDKFSSFNEIIPAIEKSAKELKDCKLSLNILKEKKKKAETFLLKTQKQLNQLQRLEMYQSSGASDLPTIEIKAEELVKEIQSFDRAIRYYNEINKEDFTSFLNLTRFDAREHMRDELSKLAVKESINHETLSDLRVKLDRTSLIIKEIKARAKDYIETIPNVEECPLCGTNLKPKNLAQRLDTPLESIDTSRNDIDVLLENSSDLSKQRKNIENQIASLDFLEQAIELVPQLKDTSKLISELLIGLDNLREIQSKKKSEYEVIQRKLENYKTDAFTVMELNILRKELAIDIDTKELEVLIKTHIGETVDLHEETYKKIENHINNRDELIKRVEQITATCKAFSTIDSLSTSTLPNELNNIFSEVKSIDDILLLSNADTAASVDKRLTQAKELVGTFLRSLAGQISLEKLKKSRNKVKTNIKINQIKLERIEHALRVLTKLIEEEKPEILLINFLTKHTELISDIFNQIHSPQEFEGVRLLGSELFVRRKSDSQDTPLNKLSTGQRTALVLSVFLSMNKMIKSGPRLLIFDDPVTYVDDLNVLSFIDYILRISEKKDRQIFFVTANQRIASLFAKKFDFLKNTPEDFKEIRLERAYDY